MQKNENMDSESLFGSAAETSCSSKDSLQTSPVRDVESASSPLAVSLPTSPIPVAMETA